MKPLSELSLQDLSRTPVWRFSGENDTTACIEPTSITSLTENTMEVFIVRTRFFLNDGSALSGYCSPQDGSGLDYTQPVIMCGMEHAPLFHEQHPRKPEPEALCRKLGRKEVDIFPLRLRAEVPVDGQFYETIVTHVSTPQNRV